VGVVVALIALAVALTGGTAYAAVKIAPKNSVVSKSIRNGQVRTADLARAAVTRAKLARGAVTSAQVRDRSLAGADLRSDTVTGAEIDESSLGPVPSALVAGHGRSGRGSCAPAGAQWQTCGSAVMPLPVPAQVWATATVDMVAPAGTVAECRLLSGATTLETLAVEMPGQAGANHRFVLTGLAPSADGPQQLAVHCRATAGAPLLTTRFTALAVGSAG